MWKRTALATAGVLAVASAGGAVLFWPRGPYPCRATFERVKAGMTRAEVESTVGGPPGDYSAKPYQSAKPVWGGVMYETWRIDDAADLWVAFTPAGTAADVRVVTESRLQPPTMLHRVRDWLGLPQPVPPELQ